MNHTKKFFVFVFLSVSILASAKTYYVSPTGKDSNIGSITLPWGTMVKAITNARAGDTVFIRGGIYYFKEYYGTDITPELGDSFNGTKDNPICYFNYPGEHPIFDYSQQINETGFVRGMRLLHAEYIHLKGFEIRNVKQHPDGGMAVGVQIFGCNNIIIENVVVHNIGGTGFENAGCKDVYYINCDSYDNSDPYSAIPYNGADGWQLSNENHRGSYYLSGCRSWGNSDDGYDNYWNDGIVVYDSCWAINNGYLYGDGCGIKLGQTTVEPWTGVVQRIAKNCIATGNSFQGFSGNHGQCAMNVYNNTSCFNVTKYSGKTGTGFGTFGDNGGNTEIYRNNLAFGNSVDYDLRETINEAYNSWNTPPGVTISNADFISIDKNELLQARKPNGSLPDINFMKLAKGSDLIDAGTNVGLPYSGTNPDLGWSEYSTGSSTPATPIYLNSAIEDMTPARLEMNYNLSLANVVPSTSAFSVSVNSVARSVSSVSVSGTKVLLTLSSPVVFGDQVTVAYTKPATNPIQTAAGGQAASISSAAVTNRVGAPIPVYVNSSVENASPAVIQMTYSLTLANIIPATSAFTVMVNSVARNVNSVSISGAKVLLTLSGPVTYGNTVSIAYTKPATNPLQTPAGGQAVSLTAQTVTNNVAPGIPAYQSAVIENSAPAVIELIYSLSLANVVPATSAFSISVNSVARSVSSVSVSGTKVLLTLSSPVVSGDLVTVAYTKPATNPIQTAAGGQAASFGSAAVTNRVGAPPIPVYVNSSVENTSPAVIQLTYSLTLANIIPATSAFTVMVNSVARNVNSVAISGTKVLLTLSSPVTAGNTVSVAYTKPATNQIQTSAGGQAVSLTAQTVTNNVDPGNTPPVVVVDFPSKCYSGFVSELNASGSYDANKDNLTFSWTPPKNVSVSSTTGQKIRFLGPAVTTPLKLEFTLSVSDGKATQVRVVPVEILPYRPEIETAEIAKIEADTFQAPNYPYNVIDGNIGTMWSAFGDDISIIIELKHSYKVQHVKLAFQPGQRRESYFDILGSTDKLTWEPIMNKSASCNFSGDLQVFVFPPSKSIKEFKYIKLVGRGNSADLWNYISELKIFGYKQWKNHAYYDLPIKIYPNPAKDQVKILIDDPLMNPDYLQILNLSGFVVVSLNIDPDGDELTIPLDLRNGIYLVQIKSGKTIRFAQKLIIRR